MLWLDALEHRYVEEVGAMNVFFKFGDEVATPALSGSILPGIVRRSVLDLLRLGYGGSERRITIEEVYEAHSSGTLKEAFGTGTAAVISPIGRLAWRDQVIQVNEGRIGELAQKLYDTLTGIQTGRLPPMSWAGQKRFRKERPGKSFTGCPVLLHIRYDQVF